MSCDGLAVKGLPCLKMKMKIALACASDSIPNWQYFFFQKTRKL